MALKCFCTLAQLLLITIDQMLISSRTHQHSMHSPVFFWIWALSPEEAFSGLLAVLCGHCDSNSKPQMHKNTNVLSSIWRL